MKQTVTRICDSSDALLCLILSISKLYRMDQLFLLAGHFGLNTATLKKQATMGSNQWRPTCITQPSSLNFFIASAPVYVYRSCNTLKAFNKKQGTTAETCSVERRVCVFVCVREREIVSLFNYLLIILHSKHEMCNHTTAGYHYN